MQRARGLAHGVEVGVEEGVAAGAERRVLQARLHEVRLGHMGQKVYRLEDYATRDKPDLIVEHIRVEEVPGSMPRLREVWMKRCGDPLVAAG